MSFVAVWRREKWRITTLLLTFSVTICVTFFLWDRSVPLQVSAVTMRMNSVVDDVLSARKLSIREKSDVPFGDKDTVNILVLGLDSRKEGVEQHCDSIHMVSINVKVWTVMITSVPRGTYAYIPPGTWQDNEYYLANACALAGLDYGVEQIEHVVGIKSDYLVTVGFSEVLGILRTLKLPTTDSLQWLRARQSYAIGDPQRSHNQAVFIKDMAVKFLQGDGLSDLIFHLLFSFVNTDMSEATARTLYDGLLIHLIAHRPDDIVLTMMPKFDVKDLHFDLINSGSQIEAMLKKLDGRLSKLDLSRQTIEEVQAELVDYLESAVKSHRKLQQIIDGKLWLQVEDTGERETLQYAFTKIYATKLSGTDHDGAVQYIADYILEKQTEGLLIWEQKGRKLLTGFVE